MAALRNTVIAFLRHLGATNVATARRTHAGHPDRAVALVTAPGETMQ
jgi:hypothetical protein